MNRIEGSSRRQGGLALVLGSLLVGAYLLVPATALAAGNSLRLSPASSSVGNGATFTVHVIGNSAGAVSGTSASVTFDKTKLQVTAIVKGTDWVNGGAGWAGYPTSANLATFLANANSAGKIPSIAAFFLSGSLPAGDHTLFNVTFHAIATGSAVVNLPIGPSDGGMLDGSVATYGNALTVTAASPAGTYTINAAPAPTPTPSTTPAPSATPAAIPTQPPTNAGLDRSPAGSEPWLAIVLAAIAMSALAFASWRRSAHRG
jgi:hypothetical protein